MIGFIVAAFAALAVTWRPAIERIAPPAPDSFTPQIISRGAVLAKLGDCAVCHTAKSGRPLAGGRALPTPFGTLYSDNITPDPETGIGTWSREAFRRAMRDGVSRNGSHLYPALPYEHFTHVTDGDLDALYAFLMSRRPVALEAPPNSLYFPLGFRPLLAGWKMLFLQKGPVPIVIGKSAEWTRGAYLTEGLGHCGGCHTPRNIAGGEQTSRAFAGGVAEGWRAPALDGSNPAARHWTVDALQTYLTTGISPDHSAAGGPMGPVVDSLSSAPPRDVRAIATYIAAMMGNGVSRPALKLADNPDGATKAFPQGATLFAGACAGCHSTGAPMLGQGRPGLALVSNLRDDIPTSAIQAVLAGIDPPVARRGPMMPAFATSFTDQQIADVLNYSRARFTGRPAWTGLAKKVSQGRKEISQP
ncbi:cytochrome c [Sphingomonas sp. BIUV-7]|uniref:Cytochrome c n=1 Tax=Sphingomonas natans TaxID=3063330 RepID=A0ABT8Y7C1_9SPHN|nr:cytochrome c [Sphingomonas sp. BIUV-7]MDO6414219.1 cytochrome c [Sphingomonas sp. BIUV-7]